MQIILNKMFDLIRKSDLSTLENGAEFSDIAEEIAELLSDNTRDPLIDDKRHLEKDYSITDVHGRLLEFRAELIASVTDFNYKNPFDTQDFYILRAYKTQRGTWIYEKVATNNYEARIVHHVDNFKNEKSFRSFLLSQEYARDLHRALLAECGMQEKVKFK